MSTETPIVPNLTGRGPTPPDDDTAVPQALDDVGMTQSGAIAYTIETNFVRITQYATQPMGPVQRIPAPPLDKGSVAPLQHNLNDPIPVQRQQLPVDNHVPSASAVVGQVIMQQTPHRQSPKVAVNVFARTDHTQAAPILPGEMRENIFRSATAPVAADKTPTVHDTAPPRITKRQSNLSHPGQQSVTSGPIAVPPIHNQIQTTETVLRNAITALADDSADLVQTILRDFGTPQNLGSAQPGLPIMSQIAHALPQQPPQAPETYDVDLSPKDLGKVRISLTPHDSGITVSILCDVDSTAQLARRHIDHLARDLMQLGYASVDIDVSGQNANNPKSSTSQTGAQHMSNQDDSNMTVPTANNQYGPHPSHNSDGIDVKV
jgi:hypothetical protein